MALELIPAGADNVLIVRLSGKLTGADYKQFVPVIEQAIARYGKLRLLVEMHDFHGWDADALWQDVKFDFKHFNDIERLAMVGETTWQHWMATICKPFTTAKVRYFEPGDIDAARQWVEQP